MKIDNNTIIVICGTIITLAMLGAIFSGILPEQVMLILAGGAVTLGGTILGNLQRKPNNLDYEYELIMEDDNIEKEGSESDTNATQEKQ